MPEHSPPPAPTPPESSFGPLEHPVFRMLWLTWLATTGLLFLLAAIGSRGARIGWTLTSVTTTAMVYTATAAPGRVAAAGLTATVWAVLSVIALSRTGTDTARHLHITIPLPRRLHPSDSTD